MLRVISHPPPRTMFNGDMAAGQQPAYVQQAQYGRPQQSQQTEQSRLSPQALSNIYKNCTQLFLTRRLPEALTVLQPVVSDPSASIRHCPRALRVKIWGLYLAILDAAAKMGVSEGKSTWGLQEWPALVEKIRCGAVWDEVNRAYGDEGKVEAEVVVTLATLLLSHSPNQTITQKRIEAYLGAAPSALASDEDPRSMLQRAKITEIYILHVLPRVGEWEYAREFTQMSPDIDEEQKDVFYATLDQLQKDRRDMELQSQELERQREEELALEQLREQEARKVARKHSRAPSAHSRSASRRRASSAKPSERGPISKNDGASEAIVKERLAAAKAGSAVKKPTNTTSNNSAVRATGATGKNTTSTSLIHSTSALLGRLQANMMSTSGSFSMLQTVIMLAVIAWMTNNKRMRLKIKKFLILCWIKMTRTIGMGMKVTYV